MGRPVSAVSRRAASNGSSRNLTHTFRVSCHGLTNARYLPSGDNVAAVISGLPKNSSRSIKGGRSIFDILLVGLRLPCRQGRPDTQECRFGRTAVNSDHSPVRTPAFEKPIVYCAGKNADERNAQRRRGMLAGGVVAHVEVA